MNLTEILFLIALLAIFAITFVKIVNIFNWGKLYKIGYSFLLLAAFCICWLVIFVTTSQMLTLLFSYNIVYIQLLRLCNVLFIPNIFFLFFELFFHLRSISKKTIKPYNPNRNEE